MISFKFKRHHCCTAVRVHERKHIQTVIICSEYDKSLNEIFDRRIFLLSSSILQTKEYSLVHKSMTAK